MLLIIDNYDSFTYNLVHYLGELGEETIVERNDAIGVEDALAMGANGIVLSPGPCTPDKAGICLELIKKASGQTPILGVCLGHQSIAQALGAKIVRANTPKHGKPSFITHNNRGIFQGLPHFEPGQENAYRQRRHQWFATLAMSPGFPCGILLRQTCQS